MGITALFEMKFQSDKVDSAKELLTRLLPETRTYEGCQSASAHQSKDDPAVITLIEGWTSQEAQEKYTAWRMSQVEAGPCDAASLFSFLAAPPETKFLDNVAA